MSFTVVGSNIYDTTLLMTRKGQNGAPDEVIPRPGFLTLLLNDIDSLRTRVELHNLIDNLNLATNEDYVKFAEYRTLFSQTTDMIRLAYTNGQPAVQTRATDSRTGSVFYANTLTGDKAGNLFRLLAPIAYRYLDVGLPRLFSYIHAQIGTTPAFRYNFDIQPIIKLAITNEPLDYGEWIGQEGIHELERNVMIILSCSNITILAVLSIVGLGVGSHIMTSAADQEAWVGSPFMLSTDNFGNARPFTAPNPSYAQTLRLPIPRIFSAPNRPVWVQSKTSETQSVSGSTHSDEKLTAPM
ncbi:P9 [Mycoreovirus 1]|uniref:Uncharacterized protein VP9 n=1 Tax=Cryphonectria parasitica mycoreovirus 1 (strain 9B21) TaxID=230407 RepID=VP9_MYRV9|nr:P9 [Mycoreovirus 1]Q65YU7.1 RecName: Full=Uncharacterized protein VP9 [Cryphonectria parasitica mycoreovirus 1]BAD51419.1 P9 [Cryphonectria parasitica mycoreovirus 1]